jgi:hypothetical protein
VLLVEAVLPAPTAILPPALDADVPAMMDIVPAAPL